MTNEVCLARWYFGLQGVAGVIWWLSVLASDDVKRLTLGGWDPRIIVGPDLLFFVAGSVLVALTQRRVAVLIVAAWTLGVAAALFVYGLVEQQAGWGVVAMTIAAVGTTTAAATIWFGRLPTSWFFVGPFAFQPAKSSSGRNHVARSLTQLVVFWTTFFVVVPFIVVAVEERLQLTWPFLQRDLWTLVGWAVFAGGSSLGLASCLTMALIGKATPLPAETARELVIRGPYRIVRNPMAVAGAAQTFAIGLVVGSWAVVVLAVAGTVLWDVVIRPVEEADLAARFGDEYMRYTQSVGCWVPTMPQR